jgi:hypothetical protein
MQPFIEQLTHVAIEPVPMTAAGAEQVQFPEVNEKPDLQLLQEL